MVEDIEELLVCLSFFCQALMETAFTRVVLPLPIFVLPPMIMAYLEKYDSTS